jgi:hypothetical protein
MKKFISSCILLIGIVIVVLGFVTATNYIQLAIAVALYPLLAYLALKTFPRKTTAIPVVVVQTQVAPVQTLEATPDSKEESADILDINKRSFLKLIGISGISMLFYWLFTNKARGPLLGGAGGAVPETVSLEDTAGNKIDPAEKQLTDGYKITEIDDSIIAYYGFTHKDNSWFIMRLDTDTGSFRYARGSSQFTGNWTNRESLKYDYYVNVF